MMLLDITTTLDVPTLSAQVVAMGVTIALLKQWLRSDFNAVQERVKTLETIIDTKASEGDLSKLDSRMNDALARLATTVETFVRSSNDERYRSAESNFERSKEIEVKVAGLEVSVLQISNTLNRLLEQINKFTSKG